MAIKSKNKIKTKNRVKIVRKTGVASQVGRKNKHAKKIQGAKAGENKKNAEVQASPSAHAGQGEIEKDHVRKTDAPERTENGAESHLARWTAPSFILTNGEVLIYRLCAIASPFMMIWSVLQGSYIVSITFLLAFCVCLMHLVRKPVAMDCLIDLDGIKMGDKLYKYSLIESFEIDEEAKTLKFKLRNAFLPVKEIYLESQDPNYIRAVLEYFLPEEKQEAMLISREKKGFADGDEMTDEELLSYLDKMEKNIEKDS